MRLESEAGNIHVFHSQGPAPGTTCHTEESWSTSRHVAMCPMTMISDLRQALDGIYREIRRGYAMYSSLLVS